MTRRERFIFWAVAAVCGVSRFAAQARSLWDWDEVLFCLGMRNYDVTLHHPHPPGFPAYIAIGRIVRLFIHDDFRSLQTINLVAGVLLFPAVYLLALEIGLRFSTSVVAGALCAFFPNVWFYGGTAFSDVPSITLVVFAAAFLFRGRRDAEAYLVGVLLLAISIGIRPQNVLVGIFPLLVATRRRPPRDIAFAALIGTAIVLTSFIGAAAASGSFEGYRNAVRAHSEYISRVDSFRSPLRPPLWRLVALFFAKQYSSPALSILTTIFVLISMASLVRWRSALPLLYNALTFGPVAVAAWLFLDRYSVNRFSIGYCPMFAIFAADGIRRIGKRQGEAAIAVVLIIGFITYALPAFTVVRREVAPSVLAVETARENFSPALDDLFVASDMQPFVDYFMPAAPYVRVLDERAMILSSNGKVPRLIAEIFPTQPEGFVVRRQRGNLWNIARRHYFGAAYATITRFPQFVSGWYRGERSGEDEWRWMAARSLTILPPSRGDTLLRLGLTADGPATVRVLVNGKRIDTIAATGEVQREWHVLDPNDGPNELQIVTERDRAIRVRFLSWATY